MTGPPCKCGDPTCIVTRQKPDGTWREYANRRCSGRAVGKTHGGISPEAKAGHRRWSLQRWSDRHDTIRIAFDRFKAGKLSEYDFAAAIVKFGTREYQRGFGVGRRKVGRVAVVTSKQSGVPAEPDSVARPNEVGAVRG